MKRQPRDVPPPELRVSQMSKDGTSIFSNFDSTTPAMSKTNGKRRVDEDAVKEVISPLNPPVLDEEQQKIVDAQTKCAYFPVCSISDS